MREEWQGFREGRWLEAVDVRDFIQTNYRPYEEGAEFLCGPTERTEALMKKLEHLFDLERQFGGVLDIDTQTVTSLTNYRAGYLTRSGRSSSACRQTGRCAAASTPSAVSR